jgi:hypothetical protein
MLFVHPKLSLLCLSACLKTYYRFPLSASLFNFHHKLPFPLTQLPSFPPLSLINAAPLLTIIRAAFFLHFTSHTPKEKPPHAFHAHRH